MYVVFWDRGKRPHNKDSEVYWTGAFHPLREERKTSEARKTKFYPRAIKFESAAEAYDHAAEMASRSSQLWGAKVGKRCA